jgi:hypothetical protein
MTMTHQVGRPTETAEAFSGTPASLITPLVTSSPYRAVT